MITQRLALPTCPSPWPTERSAASSTSAVPIAPIVRAQSLRYRTLKSAVSETPSLIALWAMEIASHTWIQLVSELENLFYYLVLTVYSICLIRLRISSSSVYFNVWELRLALQVQLANALYNM